jgi:hypothetical protein
MHHSPKKGVVSVEDCIGMTIVSTKEGLECWETKDKSEPEGPLEKDHTSHTTAIEELKRVR